MMNNSNVTDNKQGPHAEMLDQAREQLGLPLGLPEDGPQTVTEVMDTAIKKFAGRPAFSCLGKDMTFSELGRLSDDFAAYLQNHTNLQPGDRIAIQLPNILQYPVAVCGALKAGLTVVNINPLYTPREMSHQFNDSGAKAIVILANMASNLEAILADTPLETVIVTEMADLHPPLKRILINTVVKRIKKMVPAFDLPAALSFRDVLKKGAVYTVKRPQIHVDDLAVLQYTGGTTGVAKGAMLTHSNLVSNMLQVSPLVDQVNIQPGDIFIAPLPLYHIYAFMLHAMTAFSYGAQSVLIPNPRDIPAFVKELQKWPFQVMVGLNTLFVALMNNDVFQSLNFSPMKLTLSGGMPLSESVAKEWQQMTGCLIQEGYGLTETSPVVSFNPYGHVQLGSIGIPLTATDIRIVDDEGKDQALSEAGELWVKGPQVMKGYWQRPEATAESIQDGWFATGDIATMQADGFLRIVDRKKDMILVSGFNVYPNEIENIVNGHPGVLESAAIGVPDEHSGEVVKLFIVKKDPQLSEADVQTFCHDNLTGYKRPKLVEFRSDLPKSNVGKILRRELRDT